MTWNGEERRSQTEREDADDARHVVQELAAVRMSKFLSALEAYRPLFIAAALCFFIILATMAYGIVNTNNRSFENQELYKQTVRCVATLMQDVEPATRAEILEACDDFRGEVGE